ncbi:hypothetical protein JCM11491_005675 [Sporobolomyces phaffii]
MARTAIQLVVGCYVVQHIVDSLTTSPPRAVESYLPSALVSIGVPTRDGGRVWLANKDLSAIEIESRLSADGEALAKLEIRFAIIRLAQSLYLPPGHAQLMQQTLLTYAGSETDPSIARLDHALSTIVLREEQVHYAAELEALGASIARVSVGQARNAALSEILAANERYAQPVSFCLFATLKLVPDASGFLRRTLQQRMAIASPQPTPFVPHLAGALRTTRSTAAPSSSTRHALAHVSYRKQRYYYSAD